MGKENTKRLEDLRAINVHLQEEKKCLKEKFYMYDHRMEEMENNFETFSKLLLLLKK
jgi:predicted nuclease with TOPRIM domain